MVEELKGKEIEVESHKSEEKTAICRRWRKRMMVKELEVEVERYK